MNPVTAREERKEGKCQTLLSDGSAEASGLGSGIGCQTLLLDGSEEASDLGSGIGYCIYAQAVAMVRVSSGVMTHTDGDAGAGNRFVYNGPCTALMEEQLRVNLNRL